MRLSMILAVDETGSMGTDTGLPWHIHEEMLHFKTTTVGHAVIMGRKTWELIPLHFRPLACRTNIVLSRQPILAQAYIAPGAHVVPSFEEAIQMANGMEYDEAFVIGGLEVYKVALASGKVDRILMSVIKGKHEGNVFWPGMNMEGWNIKVIGCHPQFHVLEFERDQRNDLG